MEIIYKVVPIDFIIRNWVDKYKLPDGTRLVNYKHYYDQQQGKVVFELVIEDASNAPESSDYKS